MLDRYQPNYKNYFNWFKEFNTKYMGIATTNEYSNRNNCHLWFIRQDKSYKLIMGSPAKANKRFPWNRFDKLMGTVQSTAVQPKLKKTYEVLVNTISNKNHAADKGEGQDCIILWFHQYLPQDILDLADTVVQEDLVGSLDEMCTVIHFWVGFTELENDTDSIMVVKYIQGILQPSQKSKTSDDYELRQWYYVQNMRHLDYNEADGDDNNDANVLMKKVYNDIATERRRCKCLLQVSGKEVSKAIEEANDNAQRTDEYDFGFGYDTATSTWQISTQYTVGYADEDDLELANSYVEDENVPVTDEEVDTGPKDYTCCGIGFSGRKYDINSEECCSEGNTVNFLNDETCFNF